MRTLIFIFVFFSFSHLLVSQSIETLMPKPQITEKLPGKMKPDENFIINLPENSNERVKIAAKRFLRRFSDKTGIFLKNGFPVYQNNKADMNISYEKDAVLKNNMDESYILEVKNNKILLQSPTDIGIIRGMETLLQMITYDENGYYIPEAVITDYPRFTWRGLLIDVARHFEPVDVIKRNLDAMTVVKMNVFHWHLSDDQGFRIELKSHPELYQKASDGEYYTQDQIKDIVQYAANRGIRVIPEIDVPGHATAILTAIPEIASIDREYKLERNAGIFNPTLDPTNEKTYQILDDIFGEMASLFPDEYFHIGGDENNGKDWDNSPHIQKFMKKKGFKTNHELQTYFNIRLQKILSKYHKKLIGWEEILTPGMPKSAVIHCWRGKPEWKSLVKAIKQGHPAILSNGYYIDLLLPAKNHYAVDPLPDNISISPEEKKLILGGEATMWGELVTPLTIDSRIWPRTAAIAEVLWTNNRSRNKKDLYQRLKIINHGLEEVGILNIRNKNYILRSIAEYQDNITPLKNLSEVCEPLKYYTRNKKGTEYKSFSPFVLFADACTADAPQAIEFSFLVDDFITHPVKENKNKLIKFLTEWKNNHVHFQKMKMTPKLKPLLPVSRDLSLIAGIGLDKLQGKEIDMDKLNRLLSHTKYEPVDVELAFIESFKKLMDYLKD